MNETITAFEEKLKELLALAKKNKDVIEVEKVNDVFKELNLDVHQIDKIYEYLESHNIAILNLSNDDEPDDSAILEIEQEEDDYLIGDVDNNGKVTLIDAQLVLKAALGIENFSDEKAAKAADADESGKVDLVDVTLILKAALGIISL